MIRRIDSCGRPVVDASADSKTRQEFRDDCDINLIMARYRISGQLDLFNNREPRYGDFSDVGDYQSCLNRLKDAQEAFASLPSELRKYFENDPAKLLEAVHDPSRVEELKALGLVPKDEPAPVASAVTESVPPGAASEA